SLAQTNEADALNKKIIELSKAQQYEQAIPLAQQVLAIRQKELGLDHPDVATALSTLAKLYDQQGRRADAEPFYKQALAINEKARGPDSADVDFSLSDLAGLYAEQGRYAEAEPL